MALCYVLLTEHLSISETWYSAWSSMPGGLPDWSNPDREMYSPPPRDWESVMASVARMNSVSSLGR